MYYCMYVEHFSYCLKVFVPVNLGNKLPFAFSQTYVVFDLMVFFIIPLSLRHHFCLLRCLYLFNRKRAFKTLYDLLYWWVAFNEIRYWYDLHYFYVNYVWIATQLRRYKIERNDAYFPLTLH